MNKAAQHFLSPPIGRLSFAKLSPDHGGDFLFKRFRRGDIGVDGRTFWSYKKSAKHGQSWMYPHKIDRYRRVSRKSYEASVAYAAVKSPSGIRIDGQSRRGDHEYSSKVSGRIFATTLRAIGYQVTSRATVNTSFGCSVDDLCKHLESRFTYGMSWDNFSEWHIDHIKPISSFDLLDPIEAAKANHFSNLQPLWALDNLKKSNKM